MTPFVLQCGNPPIPISLTDVPVTPASTVPTNDECDALFSTVGTVSDPRVIVLGDEPVRYGQQLYAALRDADASEVATMLIEIPPDKGAWRAIHDRLRRASISEAPHPR